MSYSRRRCFFQLFVCAQLGAMWMTGCGDDHGPGENNNNNTNQLALCGNGELEGAEECDNGTANSDTRPDACRSDCTNPRCGDYVADSGEECDDGVHNSDTEPDACRTSCLDAVCGDGVIDPLHGETCDDGNNSAGDGCSPLCTIERCGDGVVGAGEQCDCGEDADNLPPGCAGPNSDSVPDACRTNCQNASCGDGARDSGENCDDGNTDPGDGCGATCQLEICGNNVLDPGEVCDDGNATSGDGCRGDCQSDESCGNGITDYAAGEECDCGTDATPLPAGCATPNGPGPEGSCRSDCLIARCGNGFLEPAAGEVCDDGNVVSGDGCRGDCLSDETCGNGVVDAVAGELCDDGNMKSHDGCSSGCTTESPQFRRWQGAFEQGQNGHAMAYDFHRERVVVFFGSGTGALGATWEYDGSRWIPIHPSASPGARGGHRMAYDSVRHVVVLFGGTSEGYYFDDTWAYDGTTWTRANPLHTPGPRAYFAMAYDPDRELMVLHGGSTPSLGCSDTTWEYDGTDWTESPAPTHIDRRLRLHAMAYDENRGVMVMFGGFTSGGAVWDDTHEYDGTSWTDFWALSPAPPERRGHVLVYDPGLKRILLFGGDHHPTYRSDTWSYNGTWTLLSPGSSPSARTNSAGAFMAQRGSLVVHGGIGADGVLADTWEYASGNWQETSPAIVPSERYLHSMAFDSTRGKVVMFGGLGVTGDLGDTWEFDGTNWLETTPAGSPVPRQNSAMVYDSGRGVVVLHGGRDDSLSDTWEYNGSQWSQTSPTTALKAHSHAMAYDSDRELTILYGGWKNYPDWDEDWTWEYNGSQWLEVSPSPAPHRRRDISMAYDTRRRRTVLTSGRCDWNSWRFEDTWEYDGSRWTETSPHLSPPPRSRPAMVYHDARGRVLLYRGDTIQDLWEYNGIEWKEVFSLENPSSRSGMAACYDSWRHVMVIFGGYVFNDETWEFSWFSAHPDEVCDDGLDNDTDGLTDCDDPDCNARPHCKPGEICDNGADDDGDGLVDCADPNCADQACGDHGQVCVVRTCLCPGGTVETECGNGRDDDCDGLADCDDPDCSGVACWEYGFVCQSGSCACQGEAPEVDCSDGVDNDCDRLTDEQDPDCRGLPGAACSVDGDCRSGVCEPTGCGDYRASCADLHTIRSGTPDGTYTIDPDGAGGLDPLPAHCDMTTDGGGWTLVLQYLHRSRTNPELNIRSVDLPLRGGDALGVDESGTVFWGHAGNNLLDALQPTEVRFYAITSGHDRVIHFLSADSACLSHLRTGLGNCLGLQTTHRLLPDHTASLPVVMTGSSSDQGDLALTNYPFYKSYSRYFSARGGNMCWLVDDYDPAGQQNAHHTLHRVFAR